MPQSNFIISSVLYIFYKCTNDSDSINIQVCWTNTAGVWVSTNIMRWPTRRVIVKAYWRCRYIYYFFSLHITEAGLFEQTMKLSIFLNIHTYACSLVARVYLWNSAQNFINFQNKETRKHTPVRRSKTDVIYEINSNLALRSRESPAVKLNTIILISGWSFCGRVKSVS